MIALAGYPEDFPREISPKDWISVKGLMSELCKLAREKLNEH